MVGLGVPIFRVFTVDFFPDHSNPACLFRADTVVDGSV